MELHSVGPYYILEVKNAFADLFTAIYVTVSRLQTSNHYCLSCLESFNRNKSAIVKPCRSDDNRDTCV